MNKPQTVNFIVPGVPVAKGRARSRIVNAKGRQFVSHYTPGKTVNYENLVKLAAASAMQSLLPHTGPVEIVYVATFPVPESWSRKQRELALSGQRRHVSKPDLDNVQKILKDGMNGVVYKDDSQVDSVDGSKRYGYAAGLSVWVSLY